MKIILICIMIVALIFTYNKEHDCNVVPHYTDITFAT